MVAVREAALVDDQPGIDGAAGDGVVEIGPYRIALPAALRGKIGGNGGGDVLVGLRPEEFEDARVDAAGAATVLPALVEITEQLGPETYAYFRVEGLDVVEIGDRPVELAGALSARLDPRTSASPGEQVSLAINPDGLHLFEIESGDSLIVG